MIFLHFTYMFFIKSYQFKRTPHFRIFAIFLVIFLRDPKVDYGKNCKNPRNGCTFLIHIFWLKTARKNVKIPIDRFFTNKKSFKKKLVKNLFLQPKIKPQVMILGRKSWFFINPLKIDFFNFWVRKNHRKSVFRPRNIFFWKI